MYNSRSKMNRTQEDIKKVLSVAKIIQEDLLPTCQTITFADEFGESNDYKLLELNTHLSERLKGGETLYINGERDDNMVLCTHNTTHEVICAETSNSLLLIQDLKMHGDLTETTQAVSPVYIKEIFFDYAETVQRRPQLGKINRILEDAVYRGPELEHEIDKSKLVDKDELWAKVQASKAELEDILQSMQVVIIDGKVRVLDFEYHFRVLSYMLKLIDENSWALDEIDYDETVNALSDVVPREVVDSLLNIYTEESKVIDGLQLYRYKEREVCRFFAQVLLYSAGRFNLREFLQAWQDSVPEGMHTDEEMLHGIALVDRRSMPNVIWSFSEDKLPENITERFRALFEAKEKWTVPEISPYIQRLTNDKLDVNAILAKYARASKVDGIKHYSSKHAK